MVKKLKYLNLSKKIQEQETFRIVVVLVMIGLEDMEVIEVDKEMIGVDLETIGVLIKEEIGNITRDIKIIKIIDSFGSIQLL